jgi:glycosyltransferase involved in cell wall biosynthesis
MLIAQVTKHYAPTRGGVETHVQRLADGAVGAGHDVVVLTHRDPGQPSEEEIGGVRVLRFAPRIPGEHFSWAPGLWSWLRHHGSGPDVVHAHNYHALPALGAALARTQRFVFTPHFHGTGHGPLRSLAHRPYRLAGRLMFDRADRIVCVSAAEAALVGARFPRVVPKITVLPNGVDREALLGAPPLEPPSNVLLCVGRLEPYKRVDAALAATAQLGSPWRLVVIGEGTERAALEQAAADAGLGDRLTLLGTAPDSVLRGWLRSAAVVLALSEREAYGMVLADALTAGTPVVASDIPAHREVAERSGSAAVALVPGPPEPAAVAAAVQGLAGAPREPAPGLLDWSQVVGATIEVYSG